MQNVSHENDVIFMRMNIQVTYSHLVLHKDSLATEAIVDFELVMSCHKEPLIFC